MGTKLGISLATCHLIPFSIILHIFLLFSSVIATNTVAQSGNASNTGRPEIWLSRYEAERYNQPVGNIVNELRSKEQFQSDFISKNGTDFVFSSNARFLTFTCAAKYPITTKLPFIEQIHPDADYILRSRYYRISDWNPEKSEPVNDLFKIEVRVCIYCSGIDFLSFNLTCESVEPQPKAKLVSSVHIYVKRRYIIEHQGKILNISLNPLNPSDSHQSLVLPCRPSSPDIELMLEKNVPGKKDWKQITWPENDVSFDPKIGFILGYKGLGDDVLGTYRCTPKSANLTKTNCVGDRHEALKCQLVLINITRAIKNSSAPPENEFHFAPRAIFQGNTAKVKFGRSLLSQNPDYVIDCCSGVLKEPPKLYLEGCSNPLKCQLLKDTILKDIAENKKRVYTGCHSGECWSDCTRGYLTSSEIRTVVVCRGKNVDYMEEFTNLYNPLASGSVTNRSIVNAEANQVKDQGHTYGNLKQFRTIFQYVNSTDMKTATIPQKIMLTVGRHLKGGERAPSNYGPYTHLSDIAIDFVESGNFVEYDRDVYYEGEDMVFLCAGSQLIYAAGPYLRLGWKNGTKTTLRRSKGGFVHLSGSAEYFTSQFELTSGFGRTVLASKEMVSIECWMPPTDGSGWDKITRKLQILPTVAPKFIEMEKEKVGFYYRETGNILTCTVKQGLPRSDVMVTHNGKRLEVAEKQESSNYNRRAHCMHNQQRTENIKVSQTLDRKNNLVTVQIIFPAIRSHHQGTFQCIASNINSKVTRTIEVNLLRKNKPSTDSSSQEGISRPNSPPDQTVGKGHKGTNQGTNRDSDKREENGKKMINVQIQLPITQSDYYNNPDFQCACTASNFNRTTRTVDITLTERSSTTNKGSKANA